MKDVVCKNLVASLQSGQCILVAGPEIPAQGGAGASGPVGEGESVRDSFCRYLTERPARMGQRLRRVAEVLFGCVVGIAVVWFLAKIWPLPEPGGAKASSRQGAARSIGCRWANRMRGNDE